MCRMTPQLKPVLILSMSEISVDDETKIISVKLPEIKITDITVDIESMDYIFINDNTGKTLVVQYLPPANTRRVAEDIARLSVPTS